MPTRNYDSSNDGSNLRPEEDWEGNNIAVTCPVEGCREVYIVSGIIHAGQRRCPRCDKSVGRVQGGRMSGGTASVEW